MRIRNSDKADLVGGFVPAAELPSYVDDVLIYASLGHFPQPGEDGKLYVATDDNLAYRWSTTSFAYVPLGAGNGVGSGTGPNIVSTTYAQLKNMQQAKILVPGQLYRLSDFQTAVADPAGGADIRGNYEVLLLRAAAPGALEQFGYSLDYVGEVVEYSTDNVNMRTPHTGTIMRRINPARRLDVCLDYRVPMFRRYADANGVYVDYTDKTGADDHIYMPLFYPSVETLRPQDITIQGRPGYHNAVFQGSVQQVYVDYASNLTGFSTAPGSHVSGWRVTSNSSVYLFTLYGECIKLLLDNDTNLVDAVIANAYVYNLQLWRSEISSLHMGDDSNINGLRLDNSQIDSVVLGPSAVLEYAAIRDNSYVLQVTVSQSASAGYITASNSQLTALPVQERVNIIGCTNALNVAAIGDNTTYINDILFTGGGGSGSAASLVDLPEMLATADGAASFPLPTGVVGVMDVNVHEAAGVVRAVYQDNYGVGNINSAYVLELTADVGLLTGDRVMAKGYTSGNIGGVPSVPAGTSNALPKPKLKFIKLTDRMAPPAAPTDLQVMNAVRVSFDEDVSHLASLNPELWVFRYTRQKKVVRNSPPGKDLSVSKSTWRHPVHAGRTYPKSGYWGGGGITNNNLSSTYTSEFYTGVQAAVAANSHYDIQLHGPDWYRKNAAGKYQANRRKGSTVRLRLALVVDDPTSKSGKRFSELSDEMQLTLGEYVDSVNNLYVQVLRVHGPSAYRK